MHALQSLRAGCFHLVQQAAKLEMGQRGTFILTGAESSSRFMQISNTADEAARHTRSTWGSYKARSQPIFEHLQQAGGRRADLDWQSNASSSLGQVQRMRLDKQSLVFSISIFSPAINIRPPVRGRQFGQRRQSSTELIAGGSITSNRSITASMQSAGLVAFPRTQVLTWPSTAWLLTVICAPGILPLTLSSTKWKRSWQANSP